MRDVQFVLDVVVAQSFGQAPLLACGQPVDLGDAAAALEERLARIKVLVRFDQVIHVKLGEDDRSREHHEHNARERRNRENQRASRVRNHGISAEEPREHCRLTEEPSFAEYVRRALARAEHHVGLHEPREIVEEDIASHYKRMSERPKSLWHDHENQVAKHKQQNERLANDREQTIVSRANGEYQYEH